MAALELKPIVPADPNVFQNGAVPGIEGASQSFKKGAPLLRSSGKMVVYAGGGVVHGIAAEDASGVTDAEILYWPVLPGATFYACLTDALAVAQLGTAVGLVDSSGTWCLDVDDTTDEFLIEDYVRGPGGAAIGDTNAQVKGKFILTAYGTS